MIEEATGFVDEHVFWRHFCAYNFIKVLGYGGFRSGLEVKWPALILKMHGDVNRLHQHLED